MDELDVPARGGNQSFEVATIHGDDLVAVRRQKDDGHVDDIGQPGLPQQLARRPPKRLVKGLHIDASNGLSQPSLPRTAPPHLTEDPAMGDRHFTGQLGGLNSSTTNCASASEVAARDSGVNPVGARSGIRGRMCDPGPSTLGLCPQGLRVGTGLSPTSQRHICPRFAAERAHNVGRPLSERRASITVCDHQAGVWGAGR